MSRIGFAAAFLVWTQLAAAQGGPAQPGSSEAPAVLTATPEQRPDSPAAAEPVETGKSEAAAKPPEEKAPEEKKAEPEKKPEAKPTGFKLQFGDGKYELEIYSAVQLWTTYTLNAQSSADGVVPLQAVDNRADLFIRRGRLGLKGKLGSLNSFNIVMAYDGIDKDTINNAIRGGNNATGQIFFIWDAMWTFHFSPRWANLTVGHFRPQVGRESISGAFGVNSFEKTVTQNYMRKHIVGSTNGGRESGLNIGGLYNGSRWGLNYNFGIYDTTHSSLIGTLGKFWSPMVAGRIAVTLGDPEMPKYGLGYSVNFFGARTGLTLAINGTTQGMTDTFLSNSLLGFDLLANFKGFSFTAELHLMARTVAGKAAPPLPLPEPTSSMTRVWHVRGGYTFALAGFHFEPSITYSDAVGAANAPFTGRDRLFEACLAWYINKNNLKLNLAFSKNLSVPGVGGASEQTDNKRFVRGDFLGLGFQFLY